MHTHNNGTVSLTSTAVEHKV